MATVILDYDAGNVTSVQRALHHLGHAAEITADPDAVARADRVIFPGVGAAATCMQVVRERGLDIALREAVEAGKPVFGICVGMQLLYEGSDESPGRPGLGILPGRITRLPDGVKRPQMQWNRLSVDHLPGAAQHPLVRGLDGAWMYFVHSYAAGPGPEVIATTDYGGPVVAAVARNNVWATQFHPEKSAEAGRQLLENWVRWVADNIDVPGISAAPDDPAGSDVIEQRSAS